METKRILITVKAYPNPSKKYGETVCCAGIELSTGKWIRLYPIPYRDLDDAKKFAKYSVVEVNCWKARDDNRPESFQVDADSIKVIEWWDAEKKWDKRRTVILPTISRTMCEVCEEGKEKTLSLATIQPREVSFAPRKAQVKDAKAREAYYAQMEFFNKAKKAIEQIPFTFHYQFKCLHDPNCPGHDLAIIDWEIVQAFRDWRWKYRPESLLLQKIKQKWLDMMCSPDKDTSFYVGNMHRFPDIFMVLGVFYPPR